MKVTNTQHESDRAVAPGTSGTCASTPVSGSLSCEVLADADDAEWREKREASRFSLDIPLVANDARGMMVRGSCRNVSEGGVCAAFAAQFALNEELTLRLALPDSAIELPMRAVVRHVSGKRYGFKFVEVSEVQRGQLRQLRESCRTAARGLAAMSAVPSMPSEKFSILANRLVAARNSYPLKMVHVTSSVAGEGKSFVSANLAVTLARRPHARVLLIDGDLRRPTLAQTFGLGPLPGLCEWWDENAGQTAAPLYRIGDLPLWLLPAGRTEFPADVLHSPRLPELLTDVMGKFDWVIVDSPPLLPVADASLWARWADGTLIVVRGGMATGKGLRKGLESLDRAKMLGVVLNDAAEDTLPYYQQYYDTKPLDGPGSPETTALMLHE